MKLHCASFCKICLSERQGAGQGAAGTRPMMRNYVLATRYSHRSRKTIMQSE